MDAFGLKIGFPDSFVDYGPLEIRRGRHLENVLAARAFEWSRTLGWMNAPTDRSRWLMLPQTVNAYHYPEMNEIVFPAAILQPPFFNMDADDAVNYASMGAVRRGTPCPVSGSNHLISFAFFNVPRLPRLPFVCPAPLP